jgi:trehalose 6-phosphate phosphatase
LVTPLPDLSAALAGVPPDRLLVASDFDGTLAPIVAEPERARMLPEARSALERLVPLVLRVAVLSGRPTAVLERQVGIEGVLLLGDYGLVEADAEERRALDRFNREAARLLARQRGVRLESKPGSTSVHFREAPELGPSLGPLLEPLVLAAGLRWRPGRMVVEVMPARADKGGALRRLVEQLRPGGVVFAGDDTGDQPAFELLASLPLPHVALGVRSPEAPPEVFAACDAVVDRPQAAAAFFSRLAAWAGRG